MKIKTILLCIIIIVIIIFTFLLLNKNKNKQTPSTDPEIGKIPISDNELDIKILQLENQEKNIIYSPLSIKYALNMLKEGADANTKAELEKLLGTRELTKYNNIDNILSLANAMFIKKDYYNQVLDSYKNVLTTKYNAEIIPDEFKNADNINNWTKNKTLDLIDKILDDKQIKDKDDLKAILINALAIDMKWEESFAPKSTHSSEFTKIDGSKIDATTMNLSTKSENIKYYTDDELSIIKLNLDKYEDTQLEFIAIMPKDNINNYINNLNNDKLSKDISKLHKIGEKEKLALSIPRFEYQSDIKLTEDLKQLGLSDTFNITKANFTKINPNNELYVSDVFHKANINFTERGIKAAAVTTIYIEAGALIEQDKIIDLDFNKPFIYLIRDKNTNELWFIGTVYEPNLWENDKNDYVYG